jgi:hypothetical protein
MKAVFQTPWKRTSAPGFIPAPIDPYNVAVVTTHLQALFPKTTVLVHTPDLSLDVVVTLSENGKPLEVDPTIHQDLQNVVDVLVTSDEVCVFVPVYGLIPPVDYQTNMLPYIDAGSGTSWHRLLWTEQPAIFANLRDAVDFTAEMEAINDGIVRALTRQYVEEQGRGGVSSTPVVLRSDQNVVESLDVLAMYLWKYPDTVEGLYFPETRTVEWMWKETVEPYTGPANANVDVGAIISLATLPEGYVALGVHPDVGAEVQRALGETLDLKKWRTLTLVKSVQADVCVLLARALRT